MSPYCASRRMDGRLAPAQTPVSRTGPTVHEMGIQLRLGHVKLDDLRVAHVAEAFAEIPVSDSTRQRVRATLRAALNDAMPESLTPSNPAALVRLPSGKRPKALIWTEERVSRWLAACAALAACDLDDPDRERLEEACQPPSPVMVWTPTQLGAFLDHAHHDRLYALWHVVAHRGVRRGEACGEALHPAWVRARFHHLAEEIGLPPVRLHDLRHGVASLMLPAGVPMKVVQETLGHSSVTLTADTYTSVFHDVAASAAEAVAAHSTSPSRIRHAHTRPKAIIPRYDLPR
jgi:integrase